MVCVATIAKHSLWPFLCLYSFTLQVQMTIHWLSYQAKLGSGCLWCLAEFASGRLEFEWQRYGSGRDISQSGIMLYLHSDSPHMYSNALHFSSNNNIAFIDKINCLFVAKEPDSYLMQEDAKLIYGHLHTWTHATRLDTLFSVGMYINRP